MSCTHKMTWALVVGAVLVGTLAAGCPATGVGDPCVPEAIQEGGFSDTENYVETSSVQCRTRVCLVYRLAGHPEHIVGDSVSCPNPSAPNAACISAEERDERVFCTCRCSAGGGDSNLPLCTCDDGFHCVEILTKGGDGVRGGYCIRENQCESNDDCASGSCVHNQCV